MIRPDTMKLNGAITVSPGTRYGRTRSGSLLRSETAATGAKLYMNDEAAVMAPTSLAQLPNGRNRKQPKTPPKRMLNHGTLRRSMVWKTGGRNRTRASEYDSREVAARYTSPVPPGEIIASTIRIQPSQPRPAAVASV